MAKNYKKSTKRENTYSILTWKWLQGEIKKHSVTIFFASLGALGAFYNLYLAYQLTPLVKNIDSLTGRVEAMESYREQNYPLIERFIKVESAIVPIKEDIKEIKEDTNIIRNYLLPK